MKNDFYIWFKKFVLRNKKILTACILLLIKYKLVKKVFSTNASMCLNFIFAGTYMIYKNIYFHPFVF